MKNNLKKIMKAAGTLLCLLAMPTNALGANIIFKGNAGTESAGQSVTVAFYDKNADLKNITAADIKYIEQSLIAKDGSFAITVPVSEEMAQLKFVSNKSDFGSAAIQQAVYVSAQGSENGDGTEQSPCTFQKALELVEDNGIIEIDGTVTLPADFSWPVSDKTVTVTGVNDAVLDITTADNLNINCNTTFKNLTIGCSQTGSGKSSTPDNSISANGYHVIIADTVDTQSILSIRGGSLTEDVDSTNLEVYGGHYKTIYGGGSAKNVKGDCRLTVGGNVNKNYSVSDSDSSFVATAIHGGCWGGVIKGDCITTLKGNAKAAYVYGGTHGSVTSYVEGEIKVNIQGGSYMNVFAAAFVTEGKYTKSTINMTGGTVEGIFASDKCVLTGDVTMNILGGTVTRRIYAGCYNDYGLSGYSTDYYVNGNVTLVMGGNTVYNDLFNWDSGIHGGSRTKNDHDTEICKMIFLDNSYERFKSSIDKSTICEDYHEYIVTANKGGTVASSASDSVEIKADKGFSVLVNGTAFEDKILTLTNAETNVEFKSGIGSVIYDEKNVTVEYGLNTEFEPIMIVAVYDEENKSLVTASTSPINSLSSKKDIELSCNLSSGKKYILRVMIWEDTEDLVPVCEAMTVYIPESN